MATAENNKIKIEKLEDDIKNLTVSGGKNYQISPLLYIRGLMGASENMPYNL